LALDTGISMYGLPGACLAIVLKYAVLDRSVVLLTGVVQPDAVFREIVCWGYRKAN